jgi:hypothetical protein
MTAETDWHQRLVKAGKRLAAARAEETAARKEARELAIAAIADGQPEARIARDLGVDRMAIREWLGKRRR